MRGVLWLIRGLMVEAFQCFFDVVGQPYFYSVLDVVSFKVVSAEYFAILINSYFVDFVEMGD